MSDDWGAWVRDKVAAGVVVFRRRAAHRTLAFETLLGKRLARAIEAANPDVSPEVKVMALAKLLRPASGGTGL